MEKLGRKRGVSQKRETKASATEVKPLVMIAINTATISIHRTHGCPPTILVVDTGLHHWSVSASLKQKKCSLPDTGWMCGSPDRLSLFQRRRGKSVGGAGGETTQGVEYMKVTG